LLIFGSRNRHTATLNREKNAITQIPGYATGSAVVQYSNRTSSAVHDASPCFSDIR